MSAPSEDEVHLDAKVLGVTESTDGFGQVNVTLRISTGEQVDMVFRDEETWAKYRAECVPGARLQLTGKDPLWYFGRGPLE